ncbi:DUF6088 family protein [Acidihalobacter ferrooxydans]|uniref:Uncharacterized protein n=1 Tax=Acidihalobacter ferrooxydans TaxID=1765967 RepID=A0A1P8UH26_9GAMM|nr:DUF6088 family protein [Acidihalobacter ferrooxydans]APZ43110.1 hypothetical protein BW247_08440 [Acidihalobacter ferrooxydans]
MPSPAEYVSQWLDAQAEGALIRSLDLRCMVSRNQASRELARLARRGRLMRVARGLYVTVTASRFGPVPPPVDKMIQSLADITGHAIVRHGTAAANALGLTTQVPVRQIYLTDGRARTLNLGKQVIEIRRVPKWMLVLGDSLAGDIVRALEWLGPDLAEHAVGKLAGRIGQDHWNTVLEIRTHLPPWMLAAIQKGVPTSALVPIRR